MIADNKENDDELIYFGKDRHFSEAQERLRNVQNAYYIAAASVRMLATTRELSDALAWQDILTKGFKEEIDHQRLKDIAKAVSDFAVSQQKNNFQDYRHFAIVGICSALDESPIKRIAEKYPSNNFLSITILLPISNPDFFPSNELILAPW